MNESIDASFKNTYDILLRPPRHCLLPPPRSPAPPAVAAAAARQVGTSSTKPTTRQPHTTLFSLRHIHQANRANAAPVATASQHMLQTRGSTRESKG